MKKIFLIILTFLTVSVVKAQFNTLQFSPATFTADDSLTFTIDLTGTPLEGAAEAYIWTWCNDGATPSSQYPTKDGIYNAPSGYGWGNSHPRLKMTNIGGNVWRIGFTGATMYDLAPGSLAHFQFLCKSKTGDKQTSNSPRITFAPVSYVPSIYRLFPSRASQDDAITVNFYQNLATDINEQRMKPDSVVVTIFDENGVQYGTPKSWKLKQVSSKLFAASFVASNAWALPPGKKLRKFSYVIKGSSFDTNGTPIFVTGTVNEKAFDSLK